MALIPEPPEKTAETPKKGASTKVEPVFAAPSEPAEPEAPQSSAPPEAAKEIKFTQQEPVSATGRPVTESGTVVQENPAETPPPKKPKSKPVSNRGRQKGVIAGFGQTPGKTKSVSQLATEIQEETEKAATAKKAAVEEQKVVEEVQEAVGATRKSRGRTPAVVKYEPVGEGSGTVAVKGNASKTPGLNLTPGIHPASKVEFEVDPHSGTTDEYPLRLRIVPPRELLDSDDDDVHHAFLQKVWDFHREHFDKARDQSRDIRAEIRKGGRGMSPAALEQHHAEFHQMLQDAVDYRHSSAEARLPVHQIHGVRTGEQGAKGGSFVVITKVPTGPHGDVGRSYRENRVNVPRDQIFDVLKNLPGHDVSIEHHRLDKNGKHYAVVISGRKLTATEERLHPAVRQAGLKAGVWVGQSRVLGTRVKDDGTHAVRPNMWGYKSTRTLVVNPVSMLSATPAARPEPSDEIKKHEDEQEDLAKKIDAHEGQGAELARDILVKAAGRHAPRLLGHVPDPEWEANQKNALNLRYASPHISDEHRSYLVHTDMTAIRARQFNRLKRVVSHMLSVTDGQDAREDAGELAKGELTRAERDRLRVGLAEAAQARDVHLNDPEHLARIASLQRVSKKLDELRAPKNQDVTYERPGRGGTDLGERALEDEPIDSQDSLVNAGDPMAAVEHAEHLASVADEASEGDRESAVQEARRAARAADVDPLEVRDRSSEGAGLTSQEQSEDDIFSGVPESEDAGPSSNKSKRSRSRGTLPQMSQEAAVGSGLNVRHVGGTVRGVGIREQYRRNLVGGVQVIDPETLPVVGNMSPQARELAVKAFKRRRGAAIIGAWAKTTHTGDPRHLLVALGIPEITPERIHEWEKTQSAKLEEDRRWDTGAPAWQEGWDLQFRPSLERGPDGALRIRPRPVVQKSLPFKNAEGKTVVHRSLVPHEKDLDTDALIRNVQGTVQSHLGEDADIHEDVRTLLESVGEYRRQAASGSRQLPSIIHKLAQTHGVDLLGTMTESEASGDLARFEKHMETTGLLAKTQLQRLVPAQDPHTRGRTGSWIGDTAIWESRIQRDKEIRDLAKEAAEKARQERAAAVASSLAKGGDWSGFSEKMVRSLEAEHLRELQEQEDRTQGAMTQEEAARFYRRLRDDHSDAVRNYRTQLGTMGAGHLTMLNPSGALHLLNSADFENDPLSFLDALKSLRSEHWSSGTTDKHLAAHKEMVARLEEQIDQRTAEKRQELVDEPHFSILSDKAKQAAFKGLRQDAAREVIHPGDGTNSLFHNYNQFVHSLSLLHTAADRFESVAPEGSKIGELTAGEKEALARSQQAKILSGVATTAPSRGEVERFSETRSDVLERARQREIQRSVLSGETLLPTARELVESAAAGVMGLEDASLEGRVQAVRDSLKQGDDLLKEAEARATDPQAANPSAEVAKMSRAAYSIGGEAPEPEKPFEPLPEVPGLERIAAHGKIRGALFEKDHPAGLNEDQALLAVLSKRVRSTGGFGQSSTVGSGSTEESGSRRSEGRAAAARRAALPPVERARAERRLTDQSIIEAQGPHYAEAYNRVVGRLQAEGHSDWLDRIESGSGHHAQLHRAVMAEEERMLDEQVQARTRAIDARIIAMHSPANSEVRAHFETQKALLQHLIRTKFKEEFGARPEPITRDPSSLVSTAYALEDALRQWRSNPRTYQKRLDDWEKIRERAETDPTVEVPERPEPFEEPPRIIDIIDQLLDVDSERLADADDPSEVEAWFHAFHLLSESRIKGDPRSEYNKARLAHKKEELERFLREKHRPFEESVYAPEIQADTDAQWLLGKAPRWETWEGSGPEPEDQRALDAVAAMRQEAVANKERGIEEAGAPKEPEEAPQTIDDFQERSLSRQAAAAEEQLQSSATRMLLQGGERDRAALVYMLPSDYTLSGSAGAIPKGLGRYGEVVQGNTGSYQSMHRRRLMAIQNYLDSVGYFGSPGKAAEYVRSRTSGPAAAPLETGEEEAPAAAPAAEGAPKPASPPPRVPVPGESTMRDFLERVQGDDTSRSLGQLGRSTALSRQGRGTALNRRLVPAQQQEEETAPVAEGAEQPSPEEIEQRNQARILAGEAAEEEEFDPTTPIRQHLASIWSKIRSSGRTPGKPVSDKVLAFGGFVRGKDVEDQRGRWERTFKKVRDEDLNEHVAATGSHEGFDETSSVNRTNQKYLTNLMWDIGAKDRHVGEHEVALAALLHGLPQVHKDAIGRLLQQNNLLDPVAVNPFDVSKAEAATDREMAVRKLLREALAAEVTPGASGRAAMQSREVRERRNRLGQLAAIQSAYQGAMPEGVTGAQVLSEVIQAQQKASPEGQARDLSEAVAKAKQARAKAIEKATQEGGEVPAPWTEQDTHDFSVEWWRNRVASQQPAEPAAQTVSEPEAPSAPAGKVNVSDLQAFMASAPEGLDKVRLMGMYQQLHNRYGNVRGIIERGIPVTAAHHQGGPITNIDWTVPEGKFIIETVGKHLVKQGGKTNGVDNFSLHDVTGGASTEFGVTEGSTVATNPLSQGVRDAESLLYEGNRSRSRRQGRARGARGSIPQSALTRPGLQAEDVLPAPALFLAPESQGSPQAEEAAPVLEEQVPPSAVVDVQGAGKGRGRGRGRGGNSGKPSLSEMFQPPTT